MARAKNIVPSIPEGERTEVTMPFPSGNTYHISFNPATNIRSLWRQIPKGFELLETGATPVNLYERVEAEERKGKGK